MIKFILLLVCVIFPSVIISASEPRLAISRQEENLLKLLETAKKEFTFMGSPIHPGMLKQFERQTIVDYVVSFDLLASYDTNYDYSDNYSCGCVGTDGQRVYLTDEYFKDTYESGGDYGYTKVGALNNGMYAVISYSNTGGTLTTHTLHICDFYLEKAMSSKDLKPYSTIIMKTFCQVPLTGNIDLNSAKIEGNKVSFSNGAVYDFGAN